ncbi:MAG: DNA repair protein RecN [Selenomonadaceae bacterium]|nr:DNA repair protein RecN [Selenomonadaceae bacterium]
MLKSLTVWNFALLEHVEIEFGEGLNILTGETGAGKSILIDSLGAILGARVTGDAIRTGCEWLRVEAVFTVDDNEAVKEFLEDEAMNLDDDTIVIKRQLTKSGKSSVLINGSHASLTTLKKLGNLLVDIHGQHENLALLKEANQYALLDESDKEIAAALEAYKESYGDWKRAKELFEEKEAEAMNYAQRLDMLKWQKTEIEEAALKENEDEILEGKIRTLSHAEKIASYLEDSYALLNGNRGNAISVLSALAEVKKHLSDMERYDESLKNAAKIVEEAEINLEEAAYEIRDYGESMDFSPQKLDELQSRMDVIYKLRKKYGATVEDILKYYEKIKDELDSIENYDEDMRELKVEIKRLEKELDKAAADLTAKRQEGAKKISESVREALYSLGMPNARFNLKLSPLDKFASNGKDALAMTFSANPGEEEKPIAKVASGGELSRIALAIKSVSARNDKSSGSMVFDEIDTGIGGKTAQMVAERIAQIARFKQVLCITHLPQIAAMADTHLYISKFTKDDKTETKVKRLTENESINCIASMASGADATMAALDNAREMIMHAKMIKKNLEKSKK